jgi:hypothetical protein
LNLIREGGTSHACGSKTILLSLQPTGLLPDLNPARK